MAAARFAALKRCFYAMRRPVRTGQGCFAVAMVPLRSGGRPAEKKMPAVISAGAQRGGDIPAPLFM